MVSIVQPQWLSCKLPLGGQISPLCPLVQPNNTTINQCAAGCGLGQSGEGAAAPFLRGKIDNFCWGGGGGGITFILQLSGGLQLLCPFAILHNMTIKHSVLWSMLEWCWEGGVAIFRRKKSMIFLLGRGWWWDRLHFAPDLQKWFW
jgi:hypothetical protein